MMRRSALSVSVGLVLGALLLTGCSRREPAVKAPPQAPKPAAPAQPHPDLATVLDNVRKATGYARWKDGAEQLVAEGTSVQYGLDEKYRLQFARDGRFVQTSEGRLGRMIGFDGNAGWLVDWSGAPRPFQLEELELLQLQVWIQNSHWLEEHGPFTVLVDPNGTDDAEVRLALKLKRGLLEATVTIDRASWLPTAVRCPSTGGEQSWRLEEYRQDMGLTLPHRVTLSASGLVDTFQIRTLAKADRVGAEAYAPVTTRPKDFRLDPDVPARVKVKRAGTGHLLVHPHIDGQDLGWFLLDSGMSAMFINPSAADATGMEAFGKVPVGGPGGLSLARFRQGATLTLGPLTLTKPVFIEMDLSGLSSHFGVQVAGALGYDVFARAVLEVDPAAAGVAVHDADRYQLPRGQWEPLVLAGNLPYLRCKFEGDREGIFRLDTGAQFGVIFHSPAVERFKLLEARQTRDAALRGFAGTVNLRAGKLNWLELGGRRFANLDAAFCLDQHGAVADPYSTGNVGLPLLRAFTIVFHYPAQKVALLPRSTKEGNKK